MTKMVARQSERARIHGHQTRGRVSGLGFALRALPLILVLAAGILGFAITPALAAAVTTATTTSAYDSYGNPTQITVTTVGAGQTFTTTTVNTYINDTGKWFLGRLTRAEVTNTLPDLTTATRVSEFAYSATTGLLVSETIEPGSAQALTTTYTHDSYGNRASATVSAAGIANRTTSTTYTSDGRFPATVTNALGQSESRTYDSRFGSLKTLTGPNGLQTSWTTYSLGRKVREVRADGTKTEWSYDLCAAQCPAGAVYAVSQQDKLSGGSTPIGPNSTVYLDKLNREMRKETEGFDGTAVYVDTKYDARGEVNMVSRPYYQGTSASAIQWTTQVYDAIGRTVTVISPDNGVNDMTYQGLTTQSVNALNQTDTKIKNALGQVVQVTDNLSASTSYTYDHFGNLTQTIDAASNIVAMSYDIRGRKVAMTDPDMGSWSYTYNALGELTGQTDAKSQVSTMVYDLLGRLLSRTEAEGTTDWTYDTATTGVGKLARIDGPNNYLEIPAYDALGRPAQNITTIAATSYTVTTGYDSAGRPRTLTYPSGFTARRLYNARGYLASVDDGSGSTVYWQASTVNASGQVTAEALGNGVTTTRAFNPANGLIASTQSTNGGTTLQDLSFAFDTLGNLTSRGDIRQDRDEAFTYDGLNRLTGAVLTDTDTSTQLNASSYAYDSIGNITNKSDVGTYTYGAGAAGPHAVTAAGANTYTYDGNGNMTAGAGRTLTWTSFNKPSLIHDTPTGNQTVFTYGPGRGRIQQSILRGGLTTTVTYIGAAYEKRARLNEDDELVHYIRAGATVAIFTEIDDGSALTDKTRYVHKDHLGSITALSDEAGTVTEYLSYDAHGQRRLADWQPGIPAGAGAETPRGFTGHEMLDGVNLIHMNGRVYDPVLGRFLSADPTIQYPQTTQGFNRYTYVNNNPLSYTDPSGFGFFSSIAKFFKKAIKAVGKLLKNPIVRTVIAIAAIYFIGPAVSGFITNAYITSSVGINAGLAEVLAAASEIATIASTAGGVVAGAAGGLIASGGDLQSAGIGALTGGAFGFVGASSAFGTVGQTTAGRIVAHGVIGGTSSALRGGKFGPAAFASAFAKFATPISASFGKLGGTIASAVAGGTAAVIGGGKFANGAITGAFGYLLNACNSNPCGGGEKHRQDMTGSFKNWRSPDGILAGQSGASSIEAYKNGDDLVPTREGVVTFLNDLGDQAGLAAGLSVLTPVTQPAAIPLGGISAISRGISYMLSPTPRQTTIGLAIDVGTSRIPGPAGPLVNTGIQRVVDPYIQDPP